MKCKKIINITC